MYGRRLVGIAVAWLATVGLAWGVVGLPERCPEITPQEARAAATAAVQWFERNQLDDGRWVYRYNVDTDQVDRRPHTVRHSGVTMSLYQAHEAGISGALETADRGTGWSLDNLVRHDDLAFVSPTRYAPSGGTALLTAGLAIRRLTTEDPRYDDDLFAMGRFLVAMTEPSGAVLETWDTHERAPVPDQHSIFFTGEAYFALGLLARVDPGGTHGDWAEVADRIGTYLATERDEAEDLFPPTSDHWAAYGLATSAAAGGMALDDDDATHAERLAEIFGIQVRYESQRTGSGLNRWVLRGPEALGAGMGTLGEGLGSLWQLTGEGGVMETHRDAVGERLRCTAGILYERQVDAAEAQEAAQPDLAQGAWFRLGWTQKDDQQHALSALLLAAPALAESEQRSVPTGDDSVARVLWLMVISMALVNPVRVRRLLAPLGGSEPDDDHHDRGSENEPDPPPPLLTRLAIGAGATFAALAVAALAAQRVLDAIEVSPPTAMIAAGLVVGLTAIVDFLRPQAEPLSGVSDRVAMFVPLLVPGLLRPAAVVMALAAAAHVSVGAGLAVAAVTAVCGSVILRPAGTQPTTLEGVAWRAFAALGIVGGVALMVDGIFSI